MKTGIVTIYDPLHYGNRLHNYAMHTILSELGLDCETLVPRQHKKSQYRRRKEHAVRELFASDPVEAQRRSPAITRQIRFDEFEKEYLSVKRIDAVSFEPSLARNYNWLVTGGDNVWNPWCLENLGKLDNHLLTFAHSKQRLCMAPSIATEEIPAHLRDQYHDQWVKYPWINVRSREDARHVRQITGREADILLDPVLLVDRAHWLELMKPLPEFDEKRAYCLIWFSEEDDVTEEIQNLISEATPDAHCEWYYLGSQGEPPVSTAGPAEFLYLVNNTRLMVTDSYYGVLFAVIFGKPFVYSVNNKIRALDKDLALRQMKELLELLNIPYNATGNCLWTSYAWEGISGEIPSEKESVDLLKKMFRLDLPKPEKEESNP